MKHSKCLFIFISLIILSNAGSPSLLHAQIKYHDSWATVAARKHGDITVLYYPDDGFAFINNQNKLDGIEIEIFRQFANYLKNGRGIQLKIHFVRQSNFSRLLREVKNSSGGVFGAGNITITGKREKDFQFTPAYLPNVSLMVTNEGAPGITKLADLNTTYSDFSAVVYKGTTNARLIKQLKQQVAPNLQIRYVNSDEAALKKVVENPHTFTYVDLEVYWMAVQNHMKIRRQPAGDKKSGSIGFIMPLDSDWNIPFNEFFNLGNGYKSNPAYRKILISFLGVNMTHMLQMAEKVD